MAYTVYYGGTYGITEYHCMSQRYQGDCISKMAGGKGGKSLIGRDTAQQLRGGDQ